MTAIVEVDGVITGDLCCTRCDTVVASLKGKEVRLNSSGGYSGTTVILSAVMSAVVVFLVAGVVALVHRQLHRRQQGKLPDRPVAVSISQVSAPGFDTVRSKCSVGPETEDDAQSTQ